MVNTLGIKKNTIGSNSNSMSKAFKVDWNEKDF
jgi:hypothetical protein